MAKFIDDSVMDAALADIATSNVQHVTSAQPANFAGIAAVSLGSVAMSTGLGGGDFGAAANGDVSGRKTAVASQSGTASASGSATHVCLATGSVLKHVTTCSTVSTNSGQAYTVSAYDVEFLDVTP
jgi:hypothetical protein